MATRHSSRKGHRGRGKRSRTPSDAPSVEAAAERSPQIESASHIETKKRLARREEDHDLVEPQLLVKAIEVQRRQLINMQSVAQSLARRLIETYDVKRGEPDIALCIEVVGEILGWTIAALDPSSLSLVSTGLPPAPMALARSIDAQRWQLFRAQAVAQIVVNFLRGLDNTEQAEPDIGLVVSTIDETLERILEEIEPLSLGLPIPHGQ